MKFFITGGSGFIGSNFILNNINEHTFLNYDKLTYAGNQENLKSISKYKNYTFLKGDLCDGDFIQATLDSFKPDIIVNFAAESHVDRSIEGPKNFIDTNIVGTFNLLSSSLAYYNNCSENKKKHFKFLHISTDEVYGSLGSDGKFTEKSPYNPSSPYSASKAASDHLVKAWFHTYGLPTIITNCSNNYGPYQFPEKLIPLIIVNCLNGTKLPIYGDGLNVRDWIYVDDHCNAIYKVIKNGKSGETYNIGGEQELSNIELVKKICNILNNIYPSKSIKDYKDLITYVKDRPGHDFRYAIDNSKIKNELGFKSNENIDSGLTKTINWYINNLDWVNNIIENKYNQKRLGLKI